MVVHLLPAQVPLSPTAKCIITYTAVMAFSPRTSVSAISIIPCIHTINRLVSSHFISIIHWLSITFFQSRGRGAPLLLELIRCGHPVFYRVVTSFSFLAIGLSSIVNRVPIKRTALHICTLPRLSCPSSRPSHRCQHQLSFLHSIFNTLSIILLHSSYVVSRHSRLSFLLLSGLL